MAAIDLITAGTAPLLARPYYAEGDPGPIVGALAQVPEILEVALPFVGRVLGPSALSYRIKEIVIVRVSALLDCGYCVRAHSPVALDAGLTHAEIRALRGNGDLEASFSDPAERVLLTWVDEVANGRGPVRAGLVSTVREHFADHEVVELTLLVGATMMLNRFATPLDLPSDAGTLARLADEDLL